MSNTSTYTALIPTPSRSSMNTGLSAAKPSTLIACFGIFPSLQKNCAPNLNSHVRSLLETRFVGPFSVTGLRPALDSLASIFNEIRAAHPDLYSLLGTAGMECYRYVRNNPGVPSNHSAGTAIDITISGILSPQRAKKIPAGFLPLYGHFHAHGWYWGAGYRTVSDPAHFEVADETLKRWKKEGRI